MTTDIDKPTPVDPFAKRAIEATLKKKINLPFEFTALKEDTRFTRADIDGGTRYLLAVKMEINGDTIYAETWGNESPEEAVEGISLETGISKLESIHRIPLKNKGELADRLRWQLIHRERFEQLDTLDYYSWVEQMDMLKELVSNSKDTKEALARVHKIDLKKMREERW